MSTRQTTDDTRIESIRIGPDDPRYLAVVDKRFNKRFSARPDYVRLVSSTDQVVSAVEDAVREGRRLVVTSGGHCLEGFVSDPEVRVIIDVSPMKRVYYDAERGAVAVEAGATVGETFRALFETWGVVIPLGEYPEIGMGGHVVGGAFGFLCRQLGLAADYLYAVEVVTVDEGGRASSVVATRETSDPHRELWWAHTGGGGGNFGVVTRYWFRSPGASGDDPATLLPRAPESITTFKAEWNWSDIDQPSFLRLLRNHGIWCERNSDADSPYASLWTLLEIHRKQFGKIIVRGVSTAGAAAERQVDDHLAALGEGIGAPHGRELARMSWLEFALNPFPDLFAAPPGGVSVKVKDALLKKRLHRSPDRRGVRLPDPHRPRRHGRDAGARNLWRADQYRRARCDRLRPTRFDSRHRMHHGLAGSAGRGEESGMGAGVLSGSVCGERRRAGPGRGVRWRIHQSSRHRPRGPGAEYLGRALAHAVLPRRTTRACSGSRRGGIRGMCSGMRCRFPRNDAAAVWGACSIRLGRRAL